MFPLPSPLLTVGAAAGGGGGGGSDPNFANVKLLIGAPGANGSTGFADESPIGRALTANGNVQVDTSAPKFDRGCILCDGSGDYLSAADSADWAMGSGAWTAETWIRLVTTNAQGAIFQQWGGSLSGSGILFRVESQKLVMDWGGQSQQAASSSLTWTGGQWYFCAYDTTGSHQWLYRDGSLLYDSAVSGTMGDPAVPLVIGGGSILTDLNGRLYDPRITKGVARYQGTCPVPTAAFPRS